MKPDLLSVAPIMPGHMERLAAHFTIHKMPAEAARAEFLRGVGAGLRFVQTTGFGGLARPIMDALPKLEIISCMGVGVDAIDVAEAKRRGIAVCNTPDVLNDDVADLAIALAIMASRRLALSDRWVRDGRWLKGAQPLASKFAGKRLGIIGLGRIGKAIAKRAQGFGMPIAYHTRNRQADQPYRYYADLVEMAGNVDILIVITPGGAGTRHIVNRAVMDALGPKGILVNVARGSCVDEPALIAALSEGRLGGAALDVFDDEPRVPAALLAMDNVVLAPHVGSGTVETRTAMCDLVVNNLLAHLEGRPLLTAV